MQYIHPARTSRIRRYLLTTSLFQIVSGLGAAITGSMAFILHQTGTNIGLLSAAGIWSGFIVSIIILDLQSMPSKICLTSYLSFI